MVNSPNVRGVPANDRSEKEMLMTMQAYVVRTIWILAMVASSLATVPQARGEEQGYQVISTGHLKTMVEADKKDFLLIDARTKEEYQEAHIAGAISIPESTFEDSLALLPKDKSAQLVFYCNGVKCGKSKKAAKKAAALGYTNILVYGEGFPVWEENGLKIVPGPDYARKVETTKMKPAELKQLIDAKGRDFVVVDVRDESEYKEGHIPGAISIPVETFAAKSDVLPKEKKIVVYCNSGGRSYNAYRKLMKLAYPSIYQTILDDWKQAGLPVEK
jgi:rhodanese-related sulfurtransferase